MKNILALVCFLLLGLSAFAQPNKKVAPALYKFLNTEFMVKYRDLRIQAESDAIRVQSGQAELKPADQYRLRTAYDQTASRANQLLESIKQDFQNPKKLKSIAEFPDMYSDGLRFKLQELADFYAANFQQALADAQVKKEEVDGSVALVLIVELIGLTKGLTNYFADIKREAKQYTEKYLHENLVQPYRWRYWEELSGSASPYEKYEKSSEADLNNTQSDDAFDRQLQKVNATIQMIPAKTDNPYGSDQFNLPPDGPAPADSSFQYEDWSPTAPTVPTAAPDSTSHRNLISKPAPASAPQQQKPAAAPKKTVPAKPIPSKSGQ